MSLEDIEMLHVYVFDSSLKVKPDSVTNSPLHKAHLHSLEVPADEFSHSYPLGCCICLCDYQDGELILELPCGHCYHKACVVQWLVKSVRCPVCKADVTAGLVSEAALQEVGDLEQQQNANHVNGRDGVVIVDSDHAQQYHTATESKNEMDDSMV